MLEIRVYSARSTWRNMKGKVATQKERGGATQGPGRGKGILNAGRWISGKGE